MATIKEAKLEDELQEKGLNAPRLTPDHIDGLIESDIYHVFPGTLQTVCCLILSNGFTIVGESACVHPENFNEGIGRKLAFDDARRKIWSVEGYLLQQRLYEKSPDDI